jgi:hypothetical protein
METSSGFRIHPREEWQGLVATALGSVASNGPATPAEAQRMLQDVKTCLNGWNVCTNQPSGIWHLASGIWHLPSGICHLAFWTTSSPASSAAFPQKMHLLCKRRLPETLGRLAAFPTTPRSCISSVWLPDSAMWPCIWTVRVAVHGGCQEIC